MIIAHQLARRNCPMVELLRPFISSIANDPEKSKRKFRAFRSEKSPRRSRTENGGAFAFCGGRAGVPDCQSRSWIFATIFSMVLDRAFCCFL